MKFALVSGERTEAQPEFIGNCPTCDSKVISKCGEVRIWHWAHSKTRVCDPWWENESEWHRTWKGKFPTDWQERIHHSPTGERHIADVKTDEGWVLEFQHSFLDPDERRARSDFYGQLVWIVDGLRRKRDKIQFFRSLEEQRPSRLNPNLVKTYTGDCSLIREWQFCRKPVLFDFGEESSLWCLIPTDSDIWVYMAEVSRDHFTQLHLGNSGAKFSDYLQSLVGTVTSIEGQHKQSLLRQQMQASVGRSQTLNPFINYRARARRRF